jgi:hypothetical protein
MGDITIPIALLNPKPDTAIQLLSVSMDDFGLIDQFVINVGDLDSERGREAVVRGFTDFLARNCVAPPPLLGQMNSLTMRMDDA